MQDFNPATGLWNDRAGGWDYDYDNMGAGASAYSLDSANAHTSDAVTDNQLSVPFIDSEPACPKASQSWGDGVTRPLTDRTKPLATRWEIRSARLLALRGKWGTAPASDACEQGHLRAAGIRVTHPLERNRSVESCLPLLGGLLFGDRRASRERRHEYRRDQDLHRGFHD
ncbi:MAG TPA: hypothetical protein VMV27_14425 [Candidatus Binataceae bacterium]|nr:hypothetical protein [Candidatus Binataceae bacterium]